MKKAIISLIVFATWCGASSGAGVEDLQQGAPDQYTVVRGDTLWDISARFLKDPWRWPELWNMNNQVRNPHRIYPGDVLVLDRSATAAQLRLVAADTVKVGPRIRAEERPPEAIPVIPANAIESFLSKPLVVGRDDLEAAPRIVATAESRIAVGGGDVAYVEGIREDQGDLWQVFRRADPLIDPETQEILGYTATYLGEAVVRQRGPVSTIEITRSVQEIYQGDRLLQVSKEAPNFGYIPHPPKQKISAKIMSGYGTLMESGRLSVVAVSRGSKDGLEPGHVLAIYRNPAAQRGYRTDPLWGRSGLSGSDEPRTYYSEQLTPRDGPVYPKSVPVTRADLAKLPEERYGLLMIFRTFDRTAYGLVMQATRPVAAFDTVGNP